MRTNLFILAIIVLLLAINYRHDSTEQYTTLGNYYPTPECEPDSIWNWDLSGQF